MSKTIRTIIVDDELHARDTISQMLKLYCPQIEVIATAENVLTGLDKIKSLSPDLVFLDIKMTDGTGFDLLNRIEEKNFALIFLTAFDEFAVKAFKFSAIDYLLKPIDPDELTNAVKKVEKEIDNNSHDLNQLLGNLEKIKNAIIFYLAASKSYLQDQFVCSQTNYYYSYPYRLNQIPRFPFCTTEKGSRLDIGHSGE